MDKLSESTLWKEYDQVGKTFEANQSFAFKVPGVVLTVLIGLTVLDDVSRTMLGLGLPFIIFFMFIWLGFGHSMINYYGLRLVDIEKRINAQLSPDHPERLSFYADHVGEGFSVIAGLKTYYVLIVLFALVGFGVSLWNFLQDEVLRDWAPLWKMVFWATPVLMTVLAVCNILIVERKTLSRKRKLLQQVDGDGHGSPAASEKAPS
jgi:hypothetical protein